MPPETSRETGAEVEWVSETNYFFRLSNFRHRLLSFYKGDPDFVTPDIRMKDVVRHVDAGLEDLSISRPVERLTWGIRVPGDGSQTIYVWLDALINYLVKSGYPWAPGEDRSGGWPADCQVIGKEIVRYEDLEKAWSDLSERALFSFHCIYWPALLMALGVPPPRRVLSHAHWTLGHRKMSKSIGNVVNPFFALDRFGVDAIRYYMAHDGGIRDDSDYGNIYIIERYNKGLKGALGNLTGRIVRAKNWKVTEAVSQYCRGGDNPDDEADIKHINQLDRLRETVDSQMQELNVGGALKAIMEVIYEVSVLV